MSDREKQIAGLKALREHVLAARRTSVVAIGDKDGQIKHIVECQEALRAIDEALAEEEGAASADVAAMIR